PDEEEFLAIAPPLRHEATGDGDLPLSGRPAGARRALHEDLARDRFLRVSDPAAVGRELTVVRGTRNDGHGLMVGPERQLPDGNWLASFDDVVEHELSIW